MVGFEKNSLYAKEQKGQKRLGDVIGTVIKVAKIATG